MEDKTLFSTAFRGYNYREVDDYIDYARQTEKELRNGCEALQEKYDMVCEQLTKVKQERDRAVTDCATLSAALKKLRQSALDQSAEPAEDYKAKYEAAAAELEQLKAEKENADPASDGLQAASEMVSEVAQVVQKVEAEARRKADALTMAAKLEKAQTDLIKRRTAGEIRSLVEMLNGFLEKHPEDASEEA